MVPGTAACELCVLEWSTSTPLRLNFLTYKMRGFESLNSPSRSNILWSLWFYGSHCRSNRVTHPVITTHGWHSNRSPLCWILCCIRASGLVWFKLHFKVSAGINHNRPIIPREQYRMRQSFMHHKEPLARSPGIPDSVQPPNNRHSTSPVTWGFDRITDDRTALLFQD